MITTLETPGVETEQSERWAWRARRAETLDRLARRYWEDSRRARGPRALALAATARELEAEARLLTAATSLRTNDTPPIDQGRSLSC